MDSHESVLDRYSDAARACEEALCCPVNYDKSLLAMLPQDAYRALVGNDSAGADRVAARLLPERTWRFGPGALDLRLDQIEMTPTGSRATGLVTWLATGTAVGMQDVPEQA